MMIKELQLPTGAGAHWDKAQKNFLECWNALQTDFGD